MTLTAEIDEPDEWSDERFLALARGMDRERAYLLLRTHLTKLRGYLAAQFSFELGGELGVEAIVHETAWKAVDRVDSYRAERGGVLHWAWCIGVNLAKDHVRAELARREREKRVAKAETSEPEGLLERLLRALEKLPARHAMILRFDLERDGLGPAAEIAATLGVSVKTLYNLRAEARALLRIVFE